MGSSPRSFRTYSKIPSARTCIDDPDYDLVDPLLLRWVDLLEKKQTFSGLYINFSYQFLKAKTLFRGLRFTGKVTVMLLNSKWRLDGLEWSGGLEAGRA